MEIDRVMIVNDHAGFHLEYQELPVLQDRAIQPEIIQSDPAPDLVQRRHCAIACKGCDVRQEATFLVTLPTVEFHPGVVVPDCPVRMDRQMHRIRDAIDEYHPQFAIHPVAASIIDERRSKEFLALRMLTQICVEFGAVGDQRQSIARVPADRPDDKRKR